MGEGHGRYEALAVSHVLGGLRGDDASEFRAHLVECRDCRLRVAELRDIAADLAATEREERRLAAIATRTAEEAGDDEEHERRRWWHGDRWGRAGAVVAAVAAVALVLGITFWNYHLRRVTGEYARAVDAQGEVLDLLTRGDAVAVETRERVRATATEGEGRIAISLAALPELADEAVLVAWLLARGEVVGREVVGVGARPADAGPLPFLLETDGADTVEVTIERAGERPPEEPGTRRLVRAELDGAAD